MENFKVSIDFSVTVSEEAADELEYLVAEFVDGVRNVAANDGGDAPEPVVNGFTVNSLNKQATDGNFYGTCYGGSPLYHVCRVTTSGVVTPIVGYPTEYLDEGSDAPISACNFDDSY